MSRINEWVFEADADGKLLFTITSSALKTRLSDEIKKLYIGKGVFCDFNRGEPTVTIKKGKGFKQTDFIKG